MLRRLRRNSVAHESVADVEFDNACFNTAFYLDYCPNYIPKDGDDEEHGELELPVVADTEQVNIGDRFRYENREWTVRSFDGLYPNQAVIVCTDQSGSLRYNVMRNIDIKELLEKGERIKPERGRKH